MDPEIKARWTAALRSGEYEQTRTFLHVKGEIKDKFCCLGVLCDLAVKDNVAVPVTTANRGPFDPVHVAYDEFTGTLPVVVGKWAGGVSGLGSFCTEDGEAGTLADLNDSGKTFDEIADVIEQYF